MPCCKAGRRPRAGERLARRPNFTANSFNLTINSSQGYTDASNSITFTLTGSWANEASVLTANANGAFLAARIFVAAFPADVHAGALATGFAASGGPVSTPDGGMTVMLLGAALGALGMARALYKELNSGTRAPDPFHARAMKQAACSARYGNVDAMLPL